MDFHVEAYQPGNSKKGRVMVWKMPQGIEKEQSILKEFPYADAAGSEVAFEEAHKFLSQIGARYTGVSTIWHRDDPTLDEVKSSEFGCRNCLYNGCECREGSRFAPDFSYDWKPSCTAYAYCD